MWFLSIKTPLLCYIISDYSIRKCRWNPPNAIGISEFWNVFRFSIFGIFDFKYGQLAVFQYFSTFLHWWLCYSSKCIKNFKLITIAKIEIFKNPQCWWNPPPPPPTSAIGLSTRYQRRRQAIWGCCTTPFLIEKSEKYPNFNSFSIHLQEVHFGMCTSF